MNLYKLLFMQLLVYSYVKCHEVEFYPGRVLTSSSLNNQNNNIRNKENNQQQVNNATKWRHFLKEKTLKATDIKRDKRATDTVFHGHPKTREELWNERFLNESTAFDQTPSLIKLLLNITLTYLHDCTPVLLYDSQVKSKESYLFQNLLREFPVTYIHGYINDNNQLIQPKLLHPTRECLHFIFFLSDVKRCANIVGKQSQSKVVVVASSSQWAVQEFLASAHSRMLVNLLVIAQSFNDEDDANLEAPYILYTHQLYTDGLGASRPVVLASWARGRYSRAPTLFPAKMAAGYAGHRFIVAAAHQPPFVFRRIISDSDGGNPRVVWDGIEFRLLKLLAERNNFSIEILEPKELQLGAGDAVAREVAAARADIGVAGMFVTAERTHDLHLSAAHAQDCAAFVTLMSTALPRYRAILGPFHWHVWLALTLTYLFGIFPLAFSDKHSLRHLLHDAGEVENLFWYVFGTFTNCFTFVGKNSWSKTDKITTRLLIGWYWLFTIIITSCYTGSIIAFVTLPIFPETIDSIEQLLNGFYRIGTLDRGGWERWFVNSSDAQARRLLRKVELVPDVAAGVRNTTRAFFWPYAFLASRAELAYIVQSNFSKTASKRAMLHISDECFVPFGVALAFPPNSLHAAKLSTDVRRLLQAGVMDKLRDEVRWEMQRSSSGKLLAAAFGGSTLKIVSVEEKGLTLADTQGMFLLLAAGFLIAAAALISEWMGGCSKRCRLRKPNEPPASESREELVTTPQSDAGVKIIADNIDSYGIRNFSAESKETLDGEIISVTAESILVHDNMDVHGWDSRRSSSVDLDKEVKEIFENDGKRRAFPIDEDEVEVKGRETNSKGVFD